MSLSIPTPIPMSTPYDHPPLHPVLSEYLQHLEFNGCRPKTIVQYRMFLVRFITDGLAGDPVSATIHDLRRFLMAEQARGNCIKTVSTKIAIIRSFYKWLYRISSRPCWGTAPSRRPKSMRGPRWAV